MMKNVLALLSGLIFGVGLTVSKMVDPQKILGFLNVFGHWDPSLIFVMLSALGVFSLGYWGIIVRRSSPILSERFYLPINKRLDLNLLIGSAIFGVGWGIGGLCPGPAFANLLAGHAKIYAFVAMMLLGMWLAHKWQTTFFA